MTKILTMKNILGLRFHIFRKISENFLNITKDLNVKLVFSFNKMNKFIKVHKDELPIESKKNVVY